MKHRSGKNQRFFVRTVFKSTLYTKKTLSFHQETIIFCRNGSYRISKCTPFTEQKTSWLFKL